MNSTLRIGLMVFGIILTPALCTYYYTEAKELVPGALLCWLGAFLNALAIGFNGMQMPVLTEWYIPPGLIWKVADYTTRLPWLIDRFVYGDVTYSVGDVCIYAGAVLFGCALIYRTGKWLRGYLWKKFFLQ